MKRDRRYGRREPGRSVDEDPIPVWPAMVRTVRVRFDDAETESVINSSASSVPVPVVKADGPRSSSANADVRTAAVVSAWYASFAAGAERLCSALAGGTGSRKERELLARFQEGIDWARREASWFGAVQPEASTSGTQPADAVVQPLEPAGGDSREFVADWLNVGDRESAVQVAVDPCMNAGDSDGVAEPGRFGVFDASIPLASQEISPVCTVMCCASFPCLAGFEPLCSIDESD